MQNIIMFVGTVWVGPIILVPDVNHQIRQLNQSELVGRPDHIPAINVYFILIGQT